MYYYNRQYASLPRIDNAKEFTSQETVDFCSDKTFILQPVAAYNLTMQAYVEGAVGCAKQYSRVALVCTNMPTRFWPDTTVDFTCKKNTLWAKRDEHDELSIANDHHVQNSFAGSCHTILVNFWLICDSLRIFTSTTSFGHEHILRKSFCWMHLPSCRSRLGHAVYLHVLYDLRIRIPHTRFPFILQWISFSGSKPLCLL